jgi:phosphoenolpyruvate phosphomutase
VSATELSATPGTRLRSMLAAPELAFLMEAHDGLSARIADVEGFKALWASGFSISTTLGVRDSDEATWTQLLGVVECMRDVTSIPIVIDGDTGYGSFNTARRFAKKAERIGAAAVCIEDKLFPKMNSYYGDNHQLADVAEFCGKIEACKAGQETSDFCVIARVEALIAGRPLEEALERSEAYRQAGADAIFIHSRKHDASEIEEYSRQWAGRLPVVIAPTTYARGTPTDVFRRAGISAVIWANQSLRAALAAMRDVCRELHETESVDRLEPTLTPLGEVFELMGYDELDRAERQFLRE